MLQTRRSAARLLQRSCRARIRTYASDSGHSHSSSHSAPVNEPIGRGVFIALGSIPLALALYKYSVSPDADPGFAGDVSKLPFITRCIRYFDYQAQRNVEINTLHTSILEQAAHDKNLFETNQVGGPHVNLKFPEVFNTGSPFNVPAGHGANLSAIQEHYRRKNQEVDEMVERKRKQREEGARAAEGGKS